MTFFPATVLLQAAAPPPGGGMMQFVMIGLIILVFYFFMIRPQARKVKKERVFREALKKGDRVVTIGGIHGKITEVSERTFMIEIDNNVKVKVEKNAVSADASQGINTEPAKQS